MNGYNRTLASHHLESYQASNSRKMKTCGVEKVTTLNVGWECSNFFKLGSLIYCLLPRHGGGKKSHVRSSRGLPTTQCIICAQLTPLLYFRSIAPDFGRDSSLRMWGFPVSDRCQHPKHVEKQFWTQNERFGTNVHIFIIESPILLKASALKMKPRLWKLIDVCREHHISVALQSWCQS